MKNINQRIINGIVTGAAVYAGICLSDIVFEAIDKKRKEYIRKTKEERKAERKAEREKVKNLFSKRIVITIVDNSKEEY